MATRRYYSANAVDNTVASYINSTSTAVTLANSPVGYPSTYPFVLALDYNTASEELVVVTAASGTTLTITRGFNGTSAAAHNAGAVVRHVITAQDLTDVQDHIAAGPNGVHGITGALGTFLTTPSSTNFASLVTDETGSGLLTFATSPTLTTPVVNNAYITSPKELTTVSATAATGTINFDILTQGVLYYTTNASANFTLNFRGNSTTTLNSIMNVGDAWSAVFLNTNGSTAYYPTTFQVDGTATGVSVKWSGGTAPSAGNASAIDAYTFTIIKTASATYTILAGGAVKFA